MVFVCILLSGSVLGLALWTIPPKPTEWGGLKRGMTRQEVLAHIPHRHSDMRETKGIDIFTANTSLGYWRLEVIYDRDGNVMFAEAQFINRRLGLFSLSPRNVL